MPFAATWMDLEIINVSEAKKKERQILYDNTYVDLYLILDSIYIYKIKIIKKSQRTDLWFPRR